MKKIWTAREFAKMLRKNGYEYVRCNGDHMIYRNRFGRSVTFTVCGGTINRMIAQRLIKENGLVIV